MRRNEALVVLAGALGVVALVVAVSLRTGDEPPIAAPTGPTTAPTPKTAMVAVEREPAPKTEPEPEVESVTNTVEEVPAPIVSAEDAKQAMARAAKALVDAGFTEEVANGMVAIVEQLRSTHRSLTGQKELSSGWYGSELLLAIWPDLPDMIRRGDVKPELVAFPAHNWNRPKAPIVTNVQLPAGDLSYALNMERWSVRVSFTAKANPKPELLAKLLEAERKGK